MNAARTGYRVWGPDEFRAFVDRNAREVFGVSFDDFIAGCREDRWLRHPKRDVAGDLASLIPYTVPRPAPLVAFRDTIFLGVTIHPLRQGRKRRAGDCSSVGRFQETSALTGRRYVFTQSCTLDAGHAGDHDNGCDGADRLTWKGVDVLEDGGPRG